MSSKVALLLLCTLISVTKCSTSSDLSSLRTSMKNYLLFDDLDSKSLKLPIEIRFLIEAVRFKLDPQSQLNALNLQTPNDAERELCGVCILFFDLIASLIDEGVKADYIADRVINICLKNAIAAEEECKGAITSMAPEWEYLAQVGALKGDRACAIFLGGNCGAVEEVNGWKVSIPEKEKSTAIPTDLIKPSKILHLTDIHLDLNYDLEAARSDCGSTFMCCSERSRRASNGSELSGYWGDFMCDLPLWTFRDMLEQIREKHPQGFEYIVLSGDYPPHDIWTQSREENTRHSAKAVEVVKEVFGDTQVFPSVGNHETFPCGSQPTSKVEGDLGPSWLYNSLAIFFDSWLDEQALRTFRRDGFYSTKASNNLRIISINTNLCSHYDYWLNLEWVDPAGQFEWLVNELLMAERSGEHVHILGHIPNGDCLQGWAREFGRIIDRFQSTVKAQFYGHVHKNYFYVFYDEATRTIPINVAMVSPSATSWLNVNPAYSVFSVDTEGVVVDRETFVFDLDKANQRPEVRPEYYRLMDARKDFDMADLSPQSHLDLALSLLYDEDKWDTFKRVYTSAGTDDVERLDVICSLITADAGSRDDCQTLLFNNANVEDTINWQ